MNHPTHVYVVDDHPLVARGLTHFIQPYCNGLTVVSMTRWEDAMQQVKTGGAPALLIADVWLGATSTLVTADQWRAACPQTPWLAISGDDDPMLPSRARAAGAQGFVHKQAAPDVFAQAVEALLRGGHWFPALDADAPMALREPASASQGLTPRQGEILALLLRGMPNKRIAAELGITEATVKEHVTGVLARLGVRTRIEAITALSQRLQRSAHETPRR
jgi:DNA-binding NarL/FixJ family response regulator